MSLTAIAILQAPPANGLGSATPSTTPARSGNETFARLLGLADLQRNAAASAERRDADAPDELPVDDLLTHAVAGLPSAPEALPIPPGLPPDATESAPVDGAAANAVILPPAYAALAGPAPAMAPLRGTEATAGPEEHRNGVRLSGGSTTEDGGLDTRGLIPVPLPLAGAAPTGPDQPHRSPSAEEPSVTDAPGPRFATPERGPAGAAVAHEHIRRTGGTQQPVAPTPAGGFATTDTLAQGASAVPVAAGSDPTQRPQPAAAAKEATRAAMAPKWAAGTQQASTEPGMTGMASNPGLPKAVERSAAPRDATPVAAGVFALPPGPLMTSTPSVAEARLPTSPGVPGFAAELGVQLTTFVREGVQHARLELHPLELGPVTVQIALDGTEARVNLAAEHAGTRQALEQALPTLAGSLREAGFTLAGGGVFEQAAQPQGDGGRSGQGRPVRGDGTAPSSAGDAEPAAAVLTPRRRGVVDLVA